MRKIDADQFNVFFYEGTEGRDDRFDDGVAFVLDQIDRAPTIDVHAHWELRHENIENDDGWTHNRCSHCKHDAIFYPTFDEDWDEDMDGEWVSLGTFQDGIEEFLTDFCPFCGATMDEVVST